MQVANITLVMVLRVGAQEISRPGIPSLQDGNWEVGS